MNKFAILLLVSITSLALFLFCQRVIPTEGFQDELELVEITLEKGIPSEYGTLKAVTVPSPGLSHLWFEDQNGTIRIVQFLHSKRQIHKSASVIPRNE